MKYFEFNLDKVNYWVIVGNLGFGKLYVFIYFLSVLKYMFDLIIIDFKFDILSWWVRENYVVVIYFVENCLKLDFVL